jgi:hypothetical protein
MGVLDSCREYFMVTSPKGCQKHVFKNGFNKDYQTANKEGTSGLPQPTIPTEEQYRRMRALGFVSVHELKVKEAKDQAAEEAEEAVIREREAENPPPVNLELWTKYTKTPGFQDKPEPRENTKNTQGVKAQPAPTVRDVTKEIEKEKEKEN